MSVAERAAALRQEVPAGVTILAVTKGRSIEECRAAVAAGLHDLGENRVQEALPKIEALPEARWHLIGHLQTNKAKHAGRFHMIQSIDSLHVAEAVARQAGRKAALLEVNVSGEASKSGCAPDEAVALAAQVDELLELRGLMCVGALAGDPTPGFLLLRQLREQAQERLGKPLPVLSMGMSDDWRQALAAGSSMLRLGRALFDQ